MKIAIDCRLIGQSGIGTYIKNIALHTINNPDHQYVLIGDRQALSVYTNIKNCTIIDCTHKSFTWKELFCYPTKKVNQCDAFLIPNFNIPWGIKVPIFSTIHDVVFFDIDGICSPFGKFIRWIYMKRALNISRTVFTVSNFSKQRIKELFNYHGNMKVIYNGISQELENYRNECVTPTSQDGDYIVYLGNLKKYKGIKDLIKAYYKARANSHFNYRLFIIGRIDSRTCDEELRGWMEKKDDNIKFITNADNRRVYQLLKGARVLVSPSHYEGFGIPPLEAMYLGTPAIVSDIPTHQEVYQDTPAIFFHVGNTDDLAEKLLNLPSNKFSVDEVIDNKYNFRKAAHQVIEYIQEELH